MALYHSAKGSVDYTTVGTATIVDGVASGFSDSSYLQISQTYNATNDKNVEIYVRAKTPTTITSSFNPIFGAADNIKYWGISSFSNALFTIRMGYSWSSSKSFDFKDMYISGGIQADTWYRFKIKGSNGIWRAEIYNDSGTLLNSDDKDWSSNTLNENYTINLKCTDNTGVYSGSIDLNASYIKIDGQPWFGVCPVEVQKHQIKGPVGYTVVGSPTITNGVVSNVDGQNYLKINGTYNSGTSPFEVQTDITTASVSNTYSRIFNLPGISLWTQGGVGSLKLDIATTNGTSINFSQGYQPSTRYLIKLVYDGSNSYAFYVNDTLISTQTGQPPNFSSTAWYTYYLAYADAVSGTTISMDLNNTYIKVNNTLWFYQPRPTQYIVKDGSLVWADPSIYLQSDGNQCIDTGIIFKANTIFEVDAFFDNMNDNRWCGGTNYKIATNTNRFPTNISGQWYDDYTQAVTSGKHKILLSISSSSFQLIVDDIIQQDISRTFLDDGSTFYIGKSRNGERGGLSGKSYGYKISQNGVLVRHFVPVPAGLVIGNFTVPSNGMFDIVNQQFYANAGTGEFTIGKDS